MQRYEVRHAGRVVGYADLDPAEDEYGVRGAFWPAPAFEALRAVVARLSAVMHAPSLCDSGPEGDAALAAADALGLDVVDARAPGPWRGARPSGS